MKIIKKYLIVIIALIAVSTYILNSSILEEIQKVRLFSLSQLNFLILILLVMYFLSGIEWRLVVNYFYSVKIKTLDLLLIPITSNLFSFIIPIQGSTVYTMFIFKRQYGINYLSTIGLSLISAVVNILLFVISFTIIVFKEGLNLNLEIDKEFLLLIPISSIFLLNSKLKKYVIKQLKVILETIYKVSFKLIFSLLAINITNICISTGFYYYLSIYLGYTFSIISIVFLVMISRVSIYLKLTPGGIGIQEVITNLLFASLQMNGPQAASIIFYGRAISLIPMLLIGPLDIIFRSLSISEIKRFKN
jgi:uncharacterized membrane protein YbhN (UPF0104 family)